MPRRTPDSGVEPFEYRPGLGVQRFRGMNRSADPAAIPPDQFHLLVNVRLTPADIINRPGMAEEYDSQSATCITGMLETGDPQPAASLWGYFEDMSPEPAGYYAIDLNAPKKTGYSPLPVIYDPGTQRQTKIIVDPAATPFQRATYAFIFQGKVCQLVSEKLNQITDINRELDSDGTTGKLQLLADIPDASDYDVVIRKELVSGEVKDVLYVPSVNAGEILRYDGTTLTAVSTGGSAQYLSMAVVLGHGLVAVGDSELVYQADPDATWVVKAHSDTTPYDVCEFRGTVYFAGTDGENIRQYVPGGASVTTYYTSATGAALNEQFFRLTSTRFGLLAWRLGENNVATNRAVTLARLVPGPTLAWVALGTSQDYVTYLSDIVELGRRVFGSWDGNQELWVETTPPSNPTGQIFEIFEAAYVTSFFENNDGVVGASGGAIPIGPLEGA